MGRALGRGDLAGHPGGHPRGARQGRRLRADRSRHHQPARDDRALGPRDARLPAPRHRLAGPAYGLDLRPAARRGPRGPRRRAHRPPARPLLLRHQADVARRERAPHLGARAVGQVRRRHRRLLPHRPDDARHLARHRRLQRLPHAPVRPRGGRLVRGAVRPLRSAARRAARPGPQLGRGRSHRPEVLPRTVAADRRHRRRPAVGTVRPDLRRGGRVEVHLRHRLLHPHQHRLVGRAQRRRAPVDRRLALPRGRDDVRPRGRHLRDRVGGAVAA